MSLELVSVIRETLGSLATIAESVENAIEAIKRTSVSISSGLEKRKLRKIANALASFYFTPVGIRMDIENYIMNPTHDNFEAIENRLKENQEIIKKFSEFVYRDMDSSLFQFPLSNIDYLFGWKSKLHLAIHDSRYELEMLSRSAKNKYLHDITQSFDEFNKKLEEAIKNLRELTT